MQQGQAGLRKSQRIGCYRCGTPFALHSLASLTMRILCNTSSGQCKAAVNFYIKGRGSCSFRLRGAGRAITRSMVCPRSCSVRSCFRAFHSSGMDSAPTAQAFTCSSPVSEISSNCTQPAEQLVPESTILAPPYKYSDVTIDMRQLRSDQGGPSAAAEALAGCR